MVPAQATSVNYHALGYGSEYLERFSEWLHDAAVERYELAEKPGRERKKRSFGKRPILRSPELLQPFFRRMDFWNCPAVCISQYLPPRHFGVGECLDPASRVVPELPPRTRDAAVQRCCGLQL